MFDRRSLAIGLFAVLVAMSQAISGGAQAPAAGAPQGRGAAPPQGQGAPGAGAPQGQGRGAGGPGGPGGAAAGGRGGRGGAYTPPVGSKELKDVLYNWAWHMGMLRSGAESELVKTLDYYGAGGMIQVNGQPCTVTTTLHMQVNYQLPGYRVQYECTLPNKQIVKNVETMSGDYAWDDDIPGAELVPGKGKSTPRPATLTERRIRLWASPHGAPKAAIAAAAGQPTSESFGENPAALLDRQAAAGVKGTTTLTWEGEKAVVKFPIPDVPGATGTATLVNYLPERVVVTNGKDTTEFVYGNWADFNNPLFKIEALYAGTIAERKNGMVVRNMTAKVTEIGQVYVIVPVPESIKKAGK